MAMRTPAKSRVKRVRSPIKSVRPKRKCCIRNTPEPSPSRKSVRRFATPGRKAKKSSRTASREDSQPRKSRPPRSSPSASLTKEQFPLSQRSLPGKHNQDAASSIVLAKLGGTTVIAEADATYAFSEATVDGSPEDEFKPITTSTSTPPPLDLPPQISLPTSTFLRQQDSPFNHGRPVFPEGPLRSTARFPRARTQSPRPPISLLTVLCQNIGSLSSTKQSTTVSHTDDGEGTARSYCLRNSQLDLLPNSAYSELSDAPSVDLVMPPFEKGNTEWSFERRSTLRYNFKELAATSNGMTFYHSIEIFEGNSMELSLHIGDYIQAIFGDLEEQPAGAASSDLEVHIGYICAFYRHRKGYFAQCVWLYDIPYFKRKYAAGNGKVITEGLRRYRGRISEDDILIVSSKSSAVDIKTINCDVKVVHTIEDFESPTDETDVMYLALWKHDSEVGILRPLTCTLQDTMEMSNPYKFIYEKETRKEVEEEEVEVEEEEVEVEEEEVEEEEEEEEEVEVEEEEVEEEEEEVEVEEEEEVKEEEVEGEEEEEVEVEEEEEEKEEEEEVEVEKEEVEVEKEEVEKEEEEVEVEKEEEVEVEEEEVEEEEEEVEVEKEEEVEVEEEEVEEEEEEEEKEEEVEEEEEEEKEEEEVEVEEEEEEKEEEEVEVEKEEEVEVEKEEELDFVPDIIPCRETESAEITRFLQESINVNQCGKILYICGMPGTGKTATVMKVLKNLQMQEATTAVKRFRVAYLNAIELNTPSDAYKILARKILGIEITDSMKAFRALNTFFTRSSTSTSQFNLPINSLMNVIVLDEADYIARGKLDVFYTFFEWPSADNSNVLMLIICNTMDLPDRMARCASRVGTSSILFTPYTHNQIQTIMEDRLQEGRHFFNTASITLCARIVGNLSGDIRKALYIYRRALEITKGKTVLPSHIKQAEEELVYSAVATAIRSFPWGIKSFLTAAVAEYMQHSSTALSLVNIMRRCKTILMASSQDFNYSSLYGFTKSILAKLAKMGIIAVVSYSPLDNPSSSSALANASETLDFAPFKETCGTNATSSQKKMTKINISADVDDLAGDVGVELLAYVDHVKETLCEDLFFERFLC
ncbi:ATPase, AAA family protein [Cardiosporidium cionae]|uniref:Origin recognition complex subunit 1 n=1 Tax=Cardiosporidium cionae TaxID=476202 RepID=A0ABQ7J766_9APIC|nr:ATPase, AAA family protein [Cardiosporidium cionae]|eukprot:KAF8819535.1 ATPase, AAA family protein [Cardiosporidium cionae]